MLKMVNLNKWVQYPRWLMAFLISVGVCILAYAANAYISEINPGNWWGMVYGIAASLLMLGDVLYAVKRRLLRLKLGTSCEWVQFHIYGGTLAGILVLMHSGFKLPVGLMNWSLWGLSLWVTISGLFGVFLQRWIPKVLSSGLSIEAVYERIPELVSQIRERAEKVVDECTETVKDFYKTNVAAVLVAPQAKAVYYVDVTGGIQTQLRQFEYVRKVLTAEEKEKLDTLEAMYRAKLELDAHYTLQRPLRWWLYTHVPASLVLVLLVALHIYAVIVY